MRTRRRKKGRKKNKERKEGWERREGERDEEKSQTNIGLNIIPEK